MLDIESRAIRHFPFTRVLFATNTLTWTFFSRSTDKGPLLKGAKKKKRELLVEKKKKENALAPAQWCAIRICTLLRMQ